MTDRVESVAKSEVAGPQNGLDAEAIQLVYRLNETLRSSADASNVLATTKHCAYVKSADGQILFTNQVYEGAFGNGVSAVGRYAHTYLDKIILAAADKSDQLILSGCTTVQFDHLGHASDGCQVRMRTIKKSLLGMGHPKSAILGLTQVQRVSTDGQTLRVLGLTRQWQMFQQLNQRDRLIAVALADGAKSRVLAERFSVTEKTIDNRRAHILKELELKNSMGLARLLCRLQDNGFADFGL